VADPRKAKNGEHIVYVVRGREQSLGYFEILRRFSDFLALRTAFVDRFPGLYIPPIPSKKSIGNTKPEFVDERCFLLNMFIRQLARCPYLVESQEFQIFVKPQIIANLQRELSLLPHMSPENHLHRIQKFYSFLGEINDTQILNQNNEILGFQAQAVKMLEFLKRFKNHID
jgi:hypothetical protein